MGPGPDGSRAKKWKYIILPGEAEEVIFDLYLEGGRSVLKVRAMAEWVMSAGQRTRRAKAKKKKKKEHRGLGDMQTVRHGWSAGFW